MESAFYTVAWDGFFAIQTFLGCLWIDLGGGGELTFESLSV
jgi:hypothetical protein